LAYTVNLTVMTDVTHIGPLETQLQATLNEIPAYTRYGAPTGGLTSSIRWSPELCLIHGLDPAAFNSSLPPRRSPSALCAR